MTVTASPSWAQKYAVGRPPLARSRSKTAAKPGVVLPGQVVQA